MQYNMLQDELANLVMCEHVNISPDSSLCLGVFCVFSGQDDLSTVYETHETSNFISKVKPVKSRRGTTVSLAHCRFHLQNKGMELEMCSK